MLFGLTSPEMILSKPDRKILSGCTLKIEYVNTYGTCGICGAAMRARQELPVSSILYIEESAYEGILGSGVEVKVGSGKCLAKSTAVVQGDEAYL